MRYVALLRAVNVGGTGKLPMADLRELCLACGFTSPRTYIASGNVLFDSGLSASAVQQRLQDALTEYAGKPVAVLLRTAAEMQAVLAANPFPAAPANRIVVVFLDQPPASDLHSTLRGRGTEQLHAGKREIYVHYGDGMGKSKLVIPAAAAGTGRNMNTVAKLVEMAR